MNFIETYNNTAKLYIKLCSETGQTAKNYVRPFISDTRPYHLVTDENPVVATLNTILNECSQHFYNAGKESLPSRLTDLQTSCYANGLSPFSFGFVDEQLVASVEDFQIAIFVKPGQYIEVKETDDYTKENWESLNIPKVRPLYAGKSCTHATLENMALMQNEVIAMLLSKMSAPVKNTTDTAKNPATTFGRGNKKRKK